MKLKSKVFIAFVALLTLFLTVAAKADTSRNILVIVSAATSLPLQNGKVHPTGYFLGEVADPLRAMQERGFTFSIATPGGVAPTLDNDSLRDIYWSLSDKNKEVAKALTFIQSLPEMSKPIVLESLTPQDLVKYDALFIPGGHGALVDLPASSALGEILEHFHGEQKPVGLICHAPVALLSAKTENGQNLFAGYQIAAFSKLEQQVAEKLFLGGSLLAYPTEALERAGLRVHNSILPFKSHVVVDRELVTGQNPFSTDEFTWTFLSLVMQSPR